MRYEGIFEILVSAFYLFVFTQFVFEDSLKLSLIPCSPPFTFSVSGGLGLVGLVFFFVCFLFHITVSLTPPQILLLTVNFDLSSSVFL